MALTAVVGVAFGITCGLTVIDVWDKFATGGRAHDAPASDAHVGLHFATDRPDAPYQQDGAEAPADHGNAGSGNEGQE
ncbi:MAG: hypothetical protein LBC63_00155 [Holophagales bacterium]|nr:hypothetical protein [Holophagales bacterium]